MWREYEETTRKTKENNRKEGQRAWSKSVAEGVRAMTTNPKLHWRWAKSVAGLSSRKGSSGLNLIRAAAD